MDWPDTVEALVREQQALAAAEPTSWRPPPAGFSTGGCFVCFPRGKPGGLGAAGEPGWAGAARIAADGRVSRALVPGEAGAPYRAGLLALREGALLAAAVRALGELPAVLLVNATGRDHPRGAGLALHLGAFLGLPSIGVTHRPLVAAGEWPEPVRGRSRPLMLEGRRVGSLLCTRDGCRPLAVSAAWRTDVATARDVVLAACRGARTPGPIRLARQVARRARAADPRGRKLATRS